MTALYADPYSESVPRASFALCLVVGALALAGCSGGQKTASPAGGGPTTPSSGAQVFADAGCGGCHTLAAARSTGSVGPSLDALKPAADRVARQVANGGRGMPAFDGQLTEQKITDVSEFVATSAAKSPVSVAARFQPDDTKVGDCHADSACFEQAFGNLAYEQGPKQALAVFTRMIDINPTVRVCHRIAHSLGAGALAHYDGKVGPAFADGSAVCWSGYYHGILERAFAGVAEENLPAVSRRLCASAEVRRNDFTAYQCVHGLGHGLMIYTGYDLQLSLDTCDKLATPWDQTSCTGGIFMENLQTSYGTKSRWLRDDDPLYPCTSVAERHKLYCYLMVTSRILDVDGGDWQKTVSWCRKAEPNWVATCFQSLGRDASGRSLQDPPEILRICALPGDMARECIYGAARDITSMDAGARRSSGFCSQAPTRHRAYCFNGIGTILGGFSNVSPARREACREAVPKKYWPYCFAGANA